MRPDMKKKVRECVGTNKWKTNVATRSTRTKTRCASLDELENMPTKSSLRKPHIMKWSDTYNQRNTNPFFRYLNKQAGRKWDDVYSDISKDDHNSRLTELIDWLVEKDVVIHDGVACYGNDSGWRRWRNVEITSSRNGSYKDMYIDPRDGILKLAPTLPSRPKRDDGWTRVIHHEKDELIQYHYIDDVWYEIKFRYLDDGDVLKIDGDGKGIHYWRQKSVTHDFLFKSKHVHLCAIYKAYGDHLLPINKRQLNSKDIKRIFD